MAKRKKPYSKKFVWRMPAMCENCPFSSSHDGRHLRQTLHPLRMLEIEAGLLAGDPFFCHKTTKQTGDGSNLVCAGALDFQAQNHVHSLYTQTCQQFEGVKEGKAELFRRLRRLGRNTSGAISVKRIAPLEPKNRKDY